MSNNDLVPFANGAKPAAAFQAALNTGEQESLADGIGASYGIIGYKGKVWSLRYRGNKYTFTRPDDNSPIAYIDVIILRQARNKSKSYYGAYDPNSSEGQRPICASMDGVKPDLDVTEKQCDTCAVCPRNVWKTDANGRKSRECTDFKRLAVLLLPNQTQRMLGAPLMEPVFLRVPPASLQPLGTYGEQLNNQGFHYAAVATRIAFDPNEPHPKMVFRGLQALSDEEAPVVLPMRESQTALRITGEDVQQSPMIAAKPTSPAIMQPLPAGSSGVELGLAPAAKTQPQPATVLDLKANTPAPAANTVADTGEVSASDADLDNRIKNLLGV